MTLNQHLDDKAKARLPKRTKAERDAAKIAREMRRVGHYVNTGSWPAEETNPDSEAIGRAMRASR